MHIFAEDQELSNLSCKKEHNEENTRALWVERLPPPPKKKKKKNLRHDVVHPEYISGLALVWLDAAEAVTSALTHTKRKVCIRHRIDDRREDGEGEKINGLWRL